MSPKITFEVEGYECSRCGHKWIPRTKTETEPTICPKCKSPYWDKPRRNDTTNQLEQARQSMKMKHKREKEP
jgi:DNA-directed RNA polymerase subunit RPC12/RpoP